MLTQLCIGLFLPYFSFQAFVRGENVRRRFRLKLPSVCADSRKSHSTSSSAMAAAATANAAQEAAAAAVALTTRQALEIADLTRQVGVAHGALRTLWAEMARMHEDMRRMKNATETATAAATAAAEAARSAATSAAAAAAAAAEAKRAPIAGAADTAMDSAKGPESPSPRDADIESASPTKFDKASSPPNNKEDKPLSPSPGVSLSPGAQRAEVLRSHLDPSEVAESGQYFSGANHGQPRRPGGGTFHGVSAISEATRRGPRMHEPHHQRFQHHLPQQQRQLQHDTEDKNVLEPQQAQSDENNSRAAVHPPSQSKAPSNQHFQPSLSQRPSPPTRQQVRLFGFKRSKYCCGCSFNVTSVSVFLRLFSNLYARDGSRPMQPKPWTSRLLLATICAMQIQNQPPLNTTSPRLARDLARIWRLCPNPERQTMRD